MADQSLCAVEGCGNKAKARGWCKKHWARWRNHGDPAKLVNPPLGSKCAVPGCDRKPHTRWKADKPVCGLHWRRLYIHGSTELRDVNFSQWAQCSVAGCDKDARSPKSGMCEMHYGRMRRNGSLDVSSPTKKLRQTSHGYVTTAAVGHPISQKNGVVYLHRKVLFDAIGEKLHQCHWCKCEIEWLGKGRRKLVVDHLDGNKFNNDRSNLVASCHQCNSTRGLFQSWVMEHKDDPFLWRLYLSAQGSP